MFAQWQTLLWLLLLPIRFYSLGILLAYLPCFRYFWSALIFSNSLGNRRFVCYIQDSDTASYFKLLYISIRFAILRICGLKTIRRFLTVLKRVNKISNCSFLEVRDVSCEFLPLDVKQKIFLRYRK